MVEYIAKSFYNSLLNDCNNLMTFLKTIVFISMSVLGGQTFKKQKLGNFAIGKS